jgi:SPP1 gp7 family putative phage head morphogenesis protein
MDKGLNPTFAWQDMIGAEHDAAFTVAKMMDTDLLATVQKRVQDAIDNGTTLQDFSKELIPELQKAGWWGKKDVIDPQTGKVVKAQLGSASRLETIFRSNLQSAYAVGQWDSISKNAATMPYLMYDAVDDSRTRPEHAARDGEVHPVTSDFWTTHFPPNGWNSLLPWQRVSGNAYLGIRAHYEGQIVKVRGARGEFTVTAQHPVLTTAGWVAAGDLRQGDELIAYAPKIDRGAMAAGAHEHEKPPTIEQAFNALARGARGACPRAAFNLHGEAVLGQGDIDVVSLDRELVHRLQAAADQLVEYLALEPAPPDPAKAALASPRPGRPVDGTAGGGSGGAGGPSAHLPGPILSSDSPAPAHINAAGPQMARDMLAALPEAISQLAEGGAGFIQLDRLWWHGLVQSGPLAPGQLRARQPRSLALGPHGDTPVAQTPTGGAEANPEAHRDLLNGAPGEVEIDRVEAISVSDYSGHVYDLQTESGQILACDGAHAPAYVLSNCRCGVIQMDAQEVKEMGLTPKAKPEIETRTWTNPRTGAQIKVPKDVDPGWHHNPGKARMEKLLAAADEKAKAMLTAEQRAAIKAARAKQAIAQANYEKRVSQMEALDELLKPKKEAQLAIDQALDANTPYLAPEIKKLQKAKPNMDPVALLATAKEKAAYYKGKALEQNWKTALIKGNEPTPEAKAHFDTLTDGQKAKLIDAVNEKTGVNAAKAELAQIAEGKADTQPGDKQKVLAKLQETGEASNNPKELLAQVEAGAFKIKQTVIISAYKKKIVEGKLPSPQQQEIFDSFDADGKAAILADIEKKKAALAAKQAKEGGDDYAALWLRAGGETSPFPAPDVFETFSDSVKAEVMKGLKQSVAKAPGAPETPKVAQAILDDTPEPKGQTTATPTINTNALIQTGPQKGSNPGGFYKDTDTGIEWYIKQPASADNARNEVLAAKLYEAAGVEAPHLELITFQGQPAIASRIIDGLRSDARKLIDTDVPGARDNFVVDAWLGNWDVVGMNYDNLLLKGGRAIRVDTGGAMRYRAQGSLKKSTEWGPDVTELESLRDGTASQTTSVFGKVTEAQELAGARKVLSITDKQIDDLVAAYGPEDAAKRKALAKTLKERREYIRSRYPDAVPEPEPVPASTARVTPTEQERIADSRVNGYAIDADKDLIEDQQVLVWQKRNAQKKDVTGGYLKVRESAAADLERQVAQASNTTPDYSDINDKIKQAIISIRSRVGKGEASFSDGAKSKIVSALTRHEQIVRALTTEVKEKRRPQAQLDAYIAETGPFIEQIKNAKDSGKPAWTLPDARSTWNGVKIADAKAPGGKSPWTQKKTTYALSDLKNGRQQDNGQTFDLTRELSGIRHYERTLDDGTVIRYWPQEGNTAFAMWNRIEVEAPGHGPASSARVMEAIEELGIDTTKPTRKQHELLYLQQIAYANKIDTDAAFKKAIEKGDIEAAKAHISSKTGVDLDASPHYRPEGVKQAYDHGRTVRYRPELLGSPEWSAFEKGYRLHHSVTGGNTIESMLEKVLDGGGQMAPTTDKIRRGIPPGGMSPGADLQTGGASYFFTRIKTARSAQSRPGVVWKAKVAARMDAISYGHDAFGETKGDYVRRNRRSTVAEMKNASQTSNNETILKNSLSLFDDLDRIVAGSAAERDRIIAMFKARGYDEWPDGRKLEDVIRSNR